MKNKYYSLVTTEDTATVNIYGDITSWPRLESDVSAFNLSKQLDDMQGVKNIDVYINSYGGEVAEGLAIYNALKRKCKEAKVTTYCDGFACSIASVIFMAGTERKMCNASLLMVHNAWTWGQGNAAELRKLADDMDVITSASVEAYKEVATISEAEIKKLMDDESWITPKDAIKYGFATEIIEEKEENPSQSVKKTLYDIIMTAKSGQIKGFEQKPNEDAQNKESASNDGKNGSNDGKSQKCGDDDDKKQETRRWKCKECDFIYEGDELPDGYVCPECGSTEFIEIIDDDSDDDDDPDDTANNMFSGFFNAIKNF